MPPSRLRLHISQKAETAIRGGHPWLFADSIREQNRPGETGELAILYDRKDRFLAVGLFDDGSPIRVRLLHSGKPQNLDDTWWKEHLRQTLAKREGLFDAETTGWRCCHGENDRWPGLVLDRYDATLVLKLYTAAWFPWLDKLSALLTELIPHERLVLRLSRNIREKAAQSHLDDGQVLRGVIPERPVIFKETGLRFESDVIRGQKTGFFLDQRENRRHVEKLSAGRRTLNAFSFSGGFSLYAARGGAASVTDLDISSHALENAHRNFELNRDCPPIARCQHETVQADAFIWLKEAPRKTFDLVILDPPSLAKRETERADAINAYSFLARQGLALLRPNGILAAASCSAHVSAGEFFNAIRAAAQDIQPRFHEIQTSLQPPDHPAAFPEAHYLKCIFLRL
ncbi:MAG: class I SAM-dependent methyltransferase [Verrucomicrobiae bacterium]|nr:class I SAM-dependent methyltransferase [Verrucomicrobiae bacterium]